MQLNGTIWHTKSLEMPEKGVQTAAQQQPDRMQQARLSPPVAVLHVLFSAVAAVDFTLTAQINKV
jgi:hypothetical protein